jgi:hypothetical protein
MGQRPQVGGGNWSRRNLQRVCAVMLSCRCVGVVVLCEVVRSCVCDVGVSMLIMRTRLTPDSVP